MDWMSQLGGLLQQYGGGQSPQRQSPAVDSDFDQFSQSAPQNVLSDGLAAAFRSNQTPPFPQMLGQLFGQSNGMQRANILNTLLSAVGPAVLSQVLSQRGGMGGGLGGNLLNVLRGPNPHVTPEVAEQIPAETVNDIAREAEQRDPSIVDRVSDVYAQNPALFKTLGSAALMVALTHLARRHGDGHF